MRKSKSFIVAMMIMLAVAMVSLLVVSTLTYLFKWQADKAMMGIIVTYIFAGFAGGASLNRMRKRQYEEARKKEIVSKAIEAFSLSSVFVLVLLLMSVLALQNPFEISGRFFMIWGLMASSCFFGRIL